MISYRIFLFAIAILIVTSSVGNVYAQPLDDVSASVLEFDGKTVSVKLTWNHNDIVTNYEIGCVSCMPNTLEITSESSITLDDVTVFPNTSNAMLYMIAYDSNDEIINAKQILVNLE